MEPVQFEPSGGVAPAIVPVARRKQRVIQRGAVMAPRFRLFFSPEDEQRIEALSARYDTTNVACLFRVLFERAMVRCPGPDDITPKFRKAAERAERDLEDRAFSEGRSVGIEFGARYHPYAVAMGEALGFDSTARFVRAVVLMVERGDI